ncbi:MAG TPA: response regulator [Accumulibacter sp.]|nr:response regulator [Accumulibacter sp.]HMW16958.1 response regulator [Accumulibacter sp.]HMX22807.1 response regulator [Accumulibacter sp.]HNC17210.1 response regulator [Accumulibacter sp.]HND79734.1 response regulator [Accumulibacter sp.]
MALADLKNALANKTVLIVDDDPETMLFVVRTLKTHGISTRLITCLRDAFNLLNDTEERKKIGLVVIDLQFIGQELPAALLSARQKLGRNATANNTGQALGYWLWQQRRDPMRRDNSWPRYVYASISPTFWAMAEDSSVQELIGGKPESILEQFVVGKLVRDGEEFYAALEKAWQAWPALENGNSAGVAE